MKKTWTLMIVTMVAAAFVATPCLAKTQWNANSVWPPKNHHSVGLVEFADKVKKGGAGVWGQIPMPPNAAVSDGDAKALVEWILAGAK